MNNLKSLNLFELRSIFLPGLKSGGIGIDITHTQDTPKAASLQLIGQWLHLSSTQIDYFEVGRRHCRLLLRCYGDIGSNALARAASSQSSRDMTRAKTQEYSASGTFDGEAGDRSIPILLYSQ